MKKLRRTSPAIAGYEDGKKGPRGGCGLQRLENSVKQILSSNYEKGIPSSSLIVAYGVRLDWTPNL